MKATKKSVRTRVPATPAKKSRHRKSPGSTSAVAKRLAKKYGNPTERLRARVKLEATLEPTPLSPDDKLLKLSDAAERLGIAAWTLRNWALRGKCVYRRMGELLLMIPESEVERLRSYGN